MALYELIEPMIQGMSLSCMCQPTVTDVGNRGTERTSAEGLAVEEIDTHALKKECEAALKAATGVCSRPTSEKCQCGKIALKMPPRHIASQSTIAGDSPDSSGTSSSTAWITPRFSEELESDDSRPFTAPDAGSGPGKKPDPSAGSVSSAAASGGARDADQKSGSVDRRPNFSGTWLLVQVDGPMDAFLKECCVGYFTRTAAKAINYGVNSTRNTILQTPLHDELQVRSQLSLGSYSYTVKLDGSEQQNQDPFDSRPMLLRTFWSQDGQSIVCEGKCMQTGEPLPSTRRSMQGDQMCIEQTSKSGLVVKRFFNRTQAA